MMEGIEDESPGGVIGLIFFWLFLLTFSPAFLEFSMVFSFFFSSVNWRVECREGEWGEV